ncbi:MAG: leucine-rich repeat domain-containing protein [Ruminococcus callidus]
MVEKASGAAGRRGGLRSNHAGNGTVGIEKHPVGIGGRTDLRRSDLRAAQRKRRDHWLCGRRDSTGDSGRNRWQSGNGGRGQCLLKQQKLQTVSLPDSVQSIGSQAFSGCINLQEITVPSGTQSVSNSAFSGCTNLEKAVLGTVWKHWEAACSPAVKVWQRCSFPPTCRKWAAAFSRTALR